MGSGYRTFTAGEVLSASNVQNYLQDQAVMVFAGTAARSSAIGTANFEEGMLTYLTDVDKLQVYTGATFADVYPAAASTQGITLLQSVTFSGVTSVSLPAATFTSTYENYRIVLNVTHATNSAIFQARLRASGSDNTTSNYFNLVQGLDSNAATQNILSKAQTIWSLFWGFNDANLLSLDVFSPQATKRTGLSGTAVGINSAGNEYTGYRIGSIFTATTSFDSLSFISSTGNISGKLQVYGYNE